MVGLRCWGRCSATEPRAGPPARARAADPAPAREAAGRAAADDGRGPPPARCDADALADEGRDHFAADRLLEALASYEAAYACNPTPHLSEKAFIIACNLGHLAKAKLHWRRLPLAMKTRARAICVRNGITEATLDAP